MQGMQKNSVHSPLSFLLEGLLQPSWDDENATDHMLPENVFRCSGHSQNSFPKSHHIHIVVQMVNIIIHCQNWALLLKLEHILYHMFGLNRVHCFLVDISSVKVFQLQATGFKPNFWWSRFRAKISELFSCSCNPGVFGVFNMVANWAVLQKALPVQHGRSRTNSSKGIKPLKLPSQLSDDAQVSLSESETNCGDVSSSFDLGKAVGSRAMVSCNS